jgi:hypothetical protein
LYNINNYNDLKFAIRCADVWENLKPTSNELENALNNHIERSKKRKPINDEDINKNSRNKNRVIGQLHDEEVSKLNCITLQDYLEMLIDVIQEETGTWFFYVDIAGVLFDQVQNRKIFIYQLETGYCVIFQN